MRLSIVDTLLKCIIITEVSIIGTFLMVSYNIPLIEGFMLWGSLLAALLIMCWLWGGFPIKETPGAVFFTTLLNGIMINFGGYVVMILMLKFEYGFRITVGGI